jgi:hypothetical protein
MMASIQRLRMLSIFAAFFASAGCLIYFNWMLLANLSVRLAGFLFFYVVLGSITFLAIGTRNGWSREWLLRVQSRSIPRKTMLVALCVVLTAILLSSPLLVLIPFDRWLIVCALLTVLVLVPAVVVAVSTVGFAPQRYSGLKASLMLLGVVIALSIISSVPGFSHDPLTKHTFWREANVINGAETPFSVQMRDWKFFYHGQFVTQNWDSSSFRLYVHGSRVKTLHAAQADYIGEKWANDEHLYMVYNAHHYNLRNANLDHYPQEDFRKLILRFDRKGNEAVCADITGLYTSDNFFDFERMLDSTSAEFAWWQRDVGSRTIRVDLGECWKSDYFSLRNRILCWGHWRMTDFLIAIHLLNADFSRFRCGQGLSG